MSCRANVVALVYEGLLPIKRAIMSLHQGKAKIIPLQTHGDTQQSTSHFTVENMKALWPELPIPSRCTLLGSIPPCFLPGLGLVMARIQAGAAPPWGSLPGGGWSFVQGLCTDRSPRDLSPRCLMRSREMGTDDLREVGRDVFRGAGI